MPYLFALTVLCCFVVEVFGFKAMDAYFSLSQKSFVYEYLVFVGLILVLGFQFKWLILRKYPVVNWSLFCLGFLSGLVFIGRTGNTFPFGAGPVGYLAMFIVPVILSYRFRREFRDDPYIWRLFVPLFDANKIDPEDHR